MSLAHTELSHRVAPMLIGAALSIFFVSCRQTAETDPVDQEALVTLQANDLTMIDSKNGDTRFRFTTPLLERYELAEQPYMEFREGVYVETYNDTTLLVESTLRADYAKFIEPLDLWEARGNVVATNAKGETLETEHLFWNRKEDRIYSRVDVSLTQKDGVAHGTGFESNSTMDNYRFYHPRGQVSVDATPNRDSTAVEENYESGITN